MVQIQRYINTTFIIAIFCFSVLFIAIAYGQDPIKTRPLQQEPLSFTGGNEVKTALFRETKTAMEAAKKVQANVLAPKNFNDGMKYYNTAEVEFKNGKDLEDIRKNLLKSTEYFQNAIDATILAEVSFPNSMKARQDAKFTESASYSTELWEEAEKKFREAAIDLEDGDLNDAKKKAGEAEKLYRQAELAAIKSNYLEGTKALLKQADDLDVKDNAPKTLLMSQQLVKQAEKELNDNRYDTDVARSLARQANYQVKHAIYLSNAIKQMKDKDQTWEDLMLAAEKPLEQIAEKINLVAKFDAGLGNTTNEIVSTVMFYQNNLETLDQNAVWYQQENDLKAALIVELESKLGNQAKEKSELALQIANQAKTRELFTNMENSFNRDEARVLRQGDDIIIRLVGLDFPIAKATIEQKSFALLTKVRDAIMAFPESSISVLGFTDSHGGDAQNLQLSIERADAVKEYLLANTNLDAVLIDVIGYGESKPISSNETAVGRSENRRVEVVIHPTMAIEAL